MAEHNDPNKPFTPGETTLFQQIEADSIRQARTKVNSPHHDDLDMLVKSANSLQERKKLRVECRQLANGAPESVKLQVSRILESDNKYSDLSKLKDFLALKQYKQTALTPAVYINDDTLANDVVKGQVLRDFVTKFGNMGLDVVSLAEMKQMAIQASKDRTD
mmetsp:Transcript_14534/g.22571  ORF Transcript_14534/g.22571 Transcript_14534/m.22571 type:complete len:162 (-) Transcript_14534:2333-2818(-)